MFLEFTKISNNHNLLQPSSHCDLSFPYDDFKTFLILTYLLLQVP